MIRHFAVATAALSAAFFAAAPARAETLFKIVTVKDDIIVGVNDAELKAFAGHAGGIATASAPHCSPTRWHDAVARAAAGGERRPRGPGVGRGPTMAPQPRTERPHARRQP